MNILIPILATITSISGVKSALIENSRCGEQFKLVAKIEFVTSFRDFRTYNASDGNTFASFFSTNVLDLTAGDVVSMEGFMARDPYGDHPIADLLCATKLRHEKPSPPLEATSTLLLDLKSKSRPVVLRGEIIDVVMDDIDENLFLVVQDADGRTSITCQPKDFAYLQSLIGAKVSILGINGSHSTGGMRRHLNSIMGIRDRSDITVVSPPPSNPFDAPPLDGMSDFASPSALSRMGRRRATGIVLAVRRPHNILIRNDKQRIMRISLQNANNLPYVGERITAVGLPETDAFTINLSGAVFRHEESVVHAYEAPTDIAANVITTTSPDSRLTQLRLYGKLLRLKGEFIGTSMRHSEGDTINLSCDGRSVAIDSGACASEALALRRGSIVEVVGIGFLDTETFTPTTTFPCIHGFTLILRSADDIKTLSTPPWWTVGKMLGVIGVLLVALFAIIFWNRWLQRLIRRRSSELVRMELAKATSDLHVNERTRLAVEIHDSISQSITGVSFYIDAAEKTVGEDNEAALGFLVVARQTLAACREELRRCLWDLRNNAIGEPNFENAVKRVLKPYAKAARINVHFAIPRGKMTDSTAHNILSIIRELTVNAIRHGKASSVGIIGEMREARIVFMVEDDGCGFDPANLPGLDDGHFGLCGIRDRLNRIGGSFSIESIPGRGTKVSVEVGR